MLSVFQGSLPKQLLPRIVTPSRRGRRPRDSPLSHSMLGATDPHQAAALAASMEAMNAANLMGLGKFPMPFGSIPGLGLNPVLGLPGFGFPGLSGSPVPEKESKHKESKGSKDDGDKSKDDEKNASPHPSFPLMFNPLLYNSALLAAHGLPPGLPLPTSLTGLDSSLLNGHSSGKEETVTSSSSSSKSSRHLSETGHSKRKDAPEDLSIKRKTYIENTIEAHSGSKSKFTRDVTLDNEEDMPCDLSMKPKQKEEKSKQKICSSDKLSRIVDTLKTRVNKMDEKSSKVLEEDRKSSLDVALNLADKDGDSGSSRKEESSHLSSASKRDINSLSHKHGSSSSHSNHSGSKETVPKIVQELLAAKQQRDQEELLVAKQQKVNSFAAKQHKINRDSMKSSSKSSSAQGSETEGRKRHDSMDSEKS